MREKRWLLTVAVVLCYAIQLCALPSKDKTVTLNLNGVSIENFLDAVKKQTGANMLYSADMFKGTRSVTVKANGEKWESVLKRVLTEHGFDYVIKDGIVVMRKLQHSTENDAQKIRGTVVDQKGELYPALTSTLLAIQLWVYLPVWTVPSAYLFRQEKISCKFPSSV